MPKGGYGGGTAKPSTTISNKKVSPKKVSTNTVYRNPEAGTVDYYKDKRNEYAKQIQAQMPSYQDPFNGADPMSLLLAGLHSGGGSGSGGGGGGGGGGSNAAAIAARNAALDQMLAESNGTLDSLGAQANAGFDQRQASLQGISTQAGQRLSGILGELNQGAGAARTSTAAAYGAGDQRLQALLGEYQQLSRSRDVTNNQTLGAFGAGSVNPSGGGVEDLISAGRVANTMRGNAADQMYAGRSNVYNGLNADAQMQNGQTFDALLARLTQERQAKAQELAAQKAQVALQVAQARV